MITITIEFPDSGKTVRSCGTTGFALAAVCRQLAERHGVSGDFFDADSLSDLIEFCHMNEWPIDIITVR